MIAFNTVEEMANAYMIQFNDNCNNDTGKSFSLENVMNICVKQLLKITAQAKYGITLATHSHHIPNFGYVVA